MNKYFSLLGLREDAGKDDVKAAYERRLQKYKSSDYDDDPEYVKKKLAELRVAYEQAYRMAGNGSSSAYRRDDFDLPSGSKASASRQAHRRFHDQEEKKARQRRAKKIRENEARKDQIEAEEEGSLFRKPDLSALRKKAGAIRDEIKDQAGELKNTLSQARDDNAEQSSRRSTVLNTRPKKEAAVPKSKKAVSMLSDQNGGTVMKAPYTSRENNRWDADAHNTKLIGLVIVIIIAIISGIAQCGASDFDDDDYYYDSDDTYYSYSYAFTSDRDQAVFDTAMDSCGLLYDTGYSSSWTSYASDDTMLEAQADLFASHYLDMDRLSDVLTYLYDNYDEFCITDDDPLEMQVTEVLRFYGFLDPDSAAGYINPYTDETITDAYTYLCYLNEYFERNGLTKDGESI